MADPSTFGRRLKKARATRGLTQAQLARKAGVSATMISHFETGERQFPSADNLVKIANSLNVSTDYLLGRLNDDEPDEGAVKALLRSTNLHNASDELLATIEHIAKALIEKEKSTGSNGHGGG